MSIDTLEEPRLPLDKESIEAGGTDLYQYIRLLVGELEQKILLDITNTINLGLGISNTGTWYSDIPNEDGTYDDGTWRMIKKSTGLFIEKQESSAWVEYGSFGYTA